MIDGFWRIALMLVVIWIDIFIAKHNNSYKDF